MSDFSHCYLLLSFQQYVMIQKPRPESEEEEHAVASQATARRAVAFACRGCSRHQHSLTIIPLPELVWHSLVLLPPSQYLNIPVGQSRVLDFVNIL